MSSSRSFQKRSWWPLLLTCVFVVHALTYHYFFVDDEGITLVYADSLLEGRGLTYSESDGPAEGYSNFLHVLTMAALLALVKAFGLARIWVFEAGSAFSLVCGAALVVLVWRTARRLGLSTIAGATAALLVALSAPVAVWSNSALETAPFALAFFALASSTLPTVSSPLATTVAAVVVMLLRVDGVLFAGVWLAARAVVADRATRAVLLRRVSPGLVAAAIAYLGWRVMYFGDWLTLPLQTKVAHKLLDTDGTIVWRDEAGYLLPFVRTGGWPLLPGLAALAMEWKRNDPSRQAVRSCGVALAILVAYVGLVGDWMFGFRFVVALVAPLALLGGYVIGAVEHKARWRGVAAAAVLIGASLVVAVRFTHAYETSQRRPVFWREPVSTPALRFGEYHEALVAAEPLVPPGGRIAFHDAGFVPFMLDVDNIDMLGLTSSFVGSLPSRDAVFTDVGRYYPLTEEPAHHAVHAYLLHREPDVVIVRQSWMRRVNRNGLPPLILDGHYRLAAETSSFSLYSRSTDTVVPSQTTSDFLENVAHPAYAETLAVNGEPLPVAAAGERLPALWQGGGHAVHVDPRWALHIDLESDAQVHEVYLAGSAPDQELIFDIALRGVDGQPAERLTAVVPAGTPVHVSRVLEAPAVIDAIDVRVTSASGSAARFVLSAVRVMGQTRELRAHVQTRLPETLQ